MIATPPLHPFSSSLPRFSSGHVARTVLASARRFPLRASSVVEGADRRVLLVTPDPRNRALLEVMLQRRGFEVSAFPSAEGAQRHLAWSAALPSVILSEVTLPGMDGLAFAEALRLDSRTANIPLLLLTGRFEPAQAERALALGVADLLARPIFLADVISHVLLRSEASSVDQTLQGWPKEVSLPQAVRSLLSGVRTGRVLLGSRGAIAFRRGVLVDASFDDLRGPAALVRALLLWDGDDQPYSVSFKGSSLSSATFSLDREELESTVWPLVKRWRRLASRGLPLESALALDYGALKQVLAQLPPGLHALLRLFDGRRTVRGVIESSPLGEVTTLEAVTRLYAMSVLYPAPPPREGSVKLAAAPRFMEPTPTPESQPLRGLPNGMDLPALPSVILDPELEEQLRRFQMETLDEDGGERLTGTYVLSHGVSGAAGTVPGATAGWRPRLGLVVFFACVLWAGYDLFAPVPPPAPAAKLTLPALDPAYFSPYFQRGLSKLNAGQAKEAATLLSRYVDQNPTSATAWVALGRARHADGDKAGAEIAVRRALDLAPDGTVAPEALELLTSL